MTAIRYVAAFRTYAWDDEIAEFARRFFAATPSARQVVLADETKHELVIPEYEKISHNVDTACEGMPNCKDARSLWFNVDYGIYWLQRALPDFDYYLLSESDLAVNVELEPMMRFAIEHKIDLIAHGIELSRPDWFWHKHGLTLSETPWRSLLFFMVLSRRAVDCLREARLDLARRFEVGEIDLWPFCEAFVPTVLKAIPDMRFSSVSEFADTEHLAFRPRLSAHDWRTHRPGSLVHSALGGKRYIASLLASHPPRDFFRPGSDLREALLSQTPMEDIVEPLRRLFAKERDHASIALLRDEARRQGWQRDTTLDDLAFCKPAVSSSVSSWSRYQDPERDACRANGDPLPQDYAFHTSMEAHPWWMVDLVNPCRIEEVAIINRLKEPQRFSRFRIETSDDGEVWTMQFVQNDPVPVSSDPEAPYRVCLRESRPIRYLRIVQLDPGPMHLRRVQIFGQALSYRTADPISFEEYWPIGPTTDLALCKPACSSSVSRWSRHADPERDASRANSTFLPQDYGFHTQQEENPWWMVDLLEERLVEDIAIVNRVSQAQRFQTFRIESSSDGSDWASRFEKNDSIAVSSDPESPWRLRFEHPFSARYLRVVLLGMGILHLRRVQVFGRVLRKRSHQIADNYVPVNVAAQE